MFRQFYRTVRNVDIIVYDNYKTPADWIEIWRAGISCKFIANLITIKIQANYHENDKFKFYQFGIFKFYLISAKKIDIKFCIMF